MNDILLLAVLNALADGDEDTAVGLLELAGDDESIQALLDEDTQATEGFTGTVTGSDGHEYKYVDGKRVGGAGGEKRDGKKYHSEEHEKEHLEAISGYKEETKNILRSRKTEDRNQQKQRDKEDKELEKQRYKEQREYAKKHGEDASIAHLAEKWHEEDKAIAAKRDTDDDTDILRREEEDYRRLLLIKKKLADIANKYKPEQ